MKAFKIGFTLIETLIAVAIIGVLILVARSYYGDFQKRANREIANHVLTQNVVTMERYYTQNGSYLGADDTWPGGGITSVIGSNGIAYSITYYPSVATSLNQQAYCLMVTPVQNTTTDGKTIYIDRYGTLSNTLPNNCSSTAPGNVCSSGGSYPPCSGDCDGGVWSACSGNCHNVTICAGGTGCSGNCKSSVIYGGGCSGECTNGSIVYRGCSGNCPNSTIYGGCSGHCANSTCCDAAGNCSGCNKK